jgi:hypothetical protein
MDVTTFTALGRDLQTRLRTFLDAPVAPDATPLEIAQAALDDVERQVQPASAGRRVFPFTRVTLRVWAPEESWPSIEAVLADFEPRVRARLAEVRCDAPAGLRAALCCEPPGDEGRRFVVEYERAPATPATLPRLRATVLRGAAVEQALTFTEGTILIGRVADASAEGSLVRRNHLAFLDVRDGVTETVGRVHARVRVDPATGACRVYDEGSHNGTAILRQGDVIAVARRDPRGVRLRHGDQLQIGRALVQIDIDEPVALAPTIQRGE